MIYKVSYVVIGGEYPGAVVNQDAPPQEGDIVKLAGQRFRVVEIADLIPPQGDFAYIHAALEPLEED